ncbi:MAG TPA: M20 family metallopeptidase [Terriglobia bacterium]|nr:M20 family metallopeptidase [Terriglobia bacterium]
MENRSLMSDPHALLNWCVSKTDDLLDCLQRAVEIESPSGAKAAIDEMARFFAAELKAAGGQVKLLHHATAGAAVLAEFPATSRDPDGRRRPKAKPILLLGHHDTVWKLGTLATMPFRARAGRASGPGILDMKSGIVGAIWALRALRALGIPHKLPVRVFLNPDEEIASLSFRRQILAEARRARAVLVLEPAAGAGALKTSRKGVGEFRLTVHGRSAHAGVNPEGGVNAVTELARQVLRIEEMTDAKRGVTLNVGLIDGGTRSNVVPEIARARVDVRVPRLADGRRIERRVFALKPVNPEARLKVEGGINRQPMERIRAAALFELAQDLGRRMGLDLTEASTGGGSDGNLTAALGIPTLDGLGGVGDGAHARHEHVVIRELPRRAALLAALIASL